MDYYQQSPFNLFGEENYYVFGEELFLSLNLETKELLYVCTSVTKKDINAFNGEFSLH